MPGGQPHSVSGWGAVRDEAVHLIEARDFDGAIARLAEGPDDDDAAGEREALLGLANFHAERYGQAAHHYQSAVDARPDVEWEQMRAACVANAQGQVNVDVPDVGYFDRDELLSAHTDTVDPRFRPEQAACTSASGAGCDSSLATRSARLLERCSSC